MAVHIDQVIPILRIFDEAKAKEFYVGFLGFTVDWEHRFAEDAPLYMQVSRWNLSLHLSEHHGDGSPGVRVYIKMTALDEFHQELSAKKYKYMRPGIESTFHGTRQVCVIDPFGNQIHFNEELKRADS